MLNLEFWYHIIFNKCSVHIYIKISLWERPYCHLSLCCVYKAMGRDVQRVVVMCTGCVNICGFASDRLGVWGAEARIDDVWTSFKVFPVFILTRVRHIQLSTFKKNWALYNRSCVVTFICTCGNMHAIVYNGFFI